MAADVGTGTTLAFSGTTGAAATLLITAMNISSVERPSLQVSTLATTVAHTFIPGDLYDPGSLELECWYDNTAMGVGGAHALLLATQTLMGAATITFPGGGTAVGQCFLTSYAPTVPLEEVMTISMSIKFTGAVVWTDL